MKPCFLCELWDYVMDTQDIYLTRSNRDISWGFRLAGGLQESSPLLVTRITPGSPAASCLKKGDVIVAMEGMPSHGLTYSDAMQILNRTGGQLQLHILPNNPDTLMNGSTVRGPSTYAYQHQRDRSYGTDSLGGSSMFSSSECLSPSSSVINLLQTQNPEAMTAHSTQHPAFQRMHSSEARPRRRNLSSSSDISGPSSYQQYLRQFCSTQRTVAPVENNRSHSSSNLISSENKQSIPDKLLKSFANPSGPKPFSYTSNTQLEKELQTAFISRRRTRSRGRSSTDNNSFVNEENYQRAVDFSRSLSRDRHTAADQSTTINNRKFSKRHDTPSPCRRNINEQQPYLQKILPPDMRNSDNQFDTLTFPSQRERKVSTSSIVLNPSVQRQPRRQVNTQATAVAAPISTYYNYSSPAATPTPFSPTSSNHTTMQPMSPYAYNPSSQPVTTSPAYNTLPVSNAAQTRTLIANQSTHLANQTADQSHANLQPYSFNNHSATVTSPAPSNLQAFGYNQPAAVTSPAPANLQPFRYNHQPAAAISPAPPANLQAFKHNNNQPTTQNVYNLNQIIHHTPTPSQGYVSTNPPHQQQVYSDTNPPVIKPLQQFKPTDVKNFNSLPRTLSQPNAAVVSQSTGSDDSFRVLQWLSNCPEMENSHAREEVLKKLGKATVSGPPSQPQHPQFARSNSNMSNYQPVAPNHHFHPKGSSFTLPSSVRKVNSVDNINAPSHFHSNSNVVLETASVITDNCSEDGGNALDRHKSIRYKGANVPSKTFQFINSAVSENGDQMSIANQRRTSLGAMPTNATLQNIRSRAQQRRQMHRQNRQPDQMELIKATIRANQQRGMRMTNQQLDSQAKPDELANNPKFQKLKEKLDQSGNSDEEPEDLRDMTSARRIDELHKIQQSQRRQNGGGYTATGEPTHF